MLLLSRQHLLDNPSTRRQHLANLRRVLAASLREVGPSASTATDNRRELLHNLTRGNLFDQIRCDSHYDRDLAVGRRGEDDHAAFDLTAMLIDERAQAVLVEA